LILVGFLCWFKEVIKSLSDVRVIFLVLLSSALQRHASHD
jgi:hypothetical protein